MKKYQMWVDGRWVDARSGKTREIVDPASGALLASVPESDRGDMEDAILAARRSFDEGPWRKTTALDRGKLLFRIAEALRQDAPALAELEVRNCGKPLP